MRRIRPIETVVVGCVLLAGAFFFGWMIVLSDAVPTEYRSASPGFSWSWDFDYRTATRKAGRQGEVPWPWPAKMTGSRLVLPLNQPLRTDGLAMTYRGMTATGGFRLDVVIYGLDPDVVYPREFGVEKARYGFVVADRRFRLEKITPRYLRMRSNPP